MNDDQIAGAANNFAGRAQSTIGDAVGDAKLQAEGRLRQAGGQAQQAYGAASDQLNSLGQELADRVQQSPLLALLGAVGLGYLLGRLTTR